MNNQNSDPIARFVTGSPFQKSRARGFRKVSQVAVPGLCLLLSACGGGMGDSRVALNQNPKKGYVITVAFQDAPGPFDSIEAFADYSVTDYSCVPEHSISGARPLPSKHVELKLRKINDTTYATDMYVDLLKDEDLYSKGVCHWAEASFSAIARRGQMTFMAPLSNLRYPLDSSETRYFSFLAYQSSRTDMLNTGNKDRNGYPDRSKTFSIRVDAKEVH